MEIRSAQIHTLADGLVLDRFWVRDPDFAGEPPQERLSEVNRSLIASLRDSAPESPSFRRTWQVGQHRPVPPAAVRTQVRTDNNTSSRYTIIDVIAFDRSGLLYDITRTLFELELSVCRAKIATYLDQVVNVFYVTDRQDRKIKDQQRLDAIRDRLLEVLDGKEGDG